MQAAPLSLPAPICDSADGGALNPDILPLSGASFVVKGERDEQPTAFGVDGIAIALSFRTSVLPASA